MYCEIMNWPVPKRCGRIGESDTTNILRVIGSRGEILDPTQAKKEADGPKNEAMSFARIRRESTARQLRSLAVR